MQPEAWLLQKPMDASQATLANGFLCGVVLKGQSTGPGWCPAIFFTGDLASANPTTDEMDVGFPGTLDTVMEFQGSADDVRRAEGMSIIGLTVNKSEGQASVMVDIGPDDDDPNAQECAVFRGAIVDLLTPDLIRNLRLRGVL